MKQIYTFLLVMGISHLSFSQVFVDSTINSATKRIFFDPSQFSLGSYGEAHYNHEIVDGQFQNGNMDLHRLILFTGYKFNKNLQFFSEIEFEHVSEVYVEQAFLNYQFNNFLNFKAGIILIPMGYVNEFHEPTLFNGVERPEVDKYLIPTTWREMGAGFHGLLKKVNLKYQLYMVNGFEGYDSGAKISGKNGLRSARQKGAEATFRTPSLSSKLTFYGIDGLRLGLSGYYGKTESSLYDGLERENQDAISIADSSCVTVGMMAVNAHYSIGKLQFTAVGNFTSLGNTKAYNEFTTNNVAKQLMGYYGELAYSFNLKKANDYPQLVPFIRYENLNTHFQVDDGVQRNKSYHREFLTTGLGLKLAPGAMFKADFQWVKSEANPRPYNVMNVGFGYWF